MAALQQRERTTPQHIHAVATGCHGMREPKNRRGAHCCGVKQRRFHGPRNLLLRLFTCRTGRFHPRQWARNGVTDRTDFPLKRIVFAKFLYIVYILSFHCTVSCKVKASRGTGKTH